MTTCKEKCMALNKARLASTLKLILAALMIASAVIGFFFSFASAFGGIASILLFVFGVILLMSWLPVIKWQKKVEKYFPFLSNYVGVGLFGIVFGVLSCGGHIGMIVLGAVIIALSVFLILLALCFRKQLEQSLHRRPKKGVVQTAAAGEMPKAGAVVLPGTPGAEPRVASSASATFVGGAPARPPPARPPPSASLPSNSGPTAV